MIIDMHTHVPLNKSDWPKFIHTCRTNNVSIAIASALGVTDWPQYPSKEVVRKANDLAFEFAQYSKGLVRWLAYINPQNANWPEELQLCLNKGAIGIKLWISIKSPDGSIEGVCSILGCAGKLKIPVLIHSFNRQVDLLKGEINTLEVASLAKKFPQTTIIAAHAGGNWQIGIKQLANLDNVYVDISGSFPQRTMVETIVRELGDEHVLFGSDMYGREQSSQLAKIIFSNITDSQRELLLYKNSCRVFGLNGNSASSQQITNYNSKAMQFMSEMVDHFCFSGKFTFMGTGVSIEELECELVRNKHTAFVANAETLYSDDLADKNNRFIAEVAGFSQIKPLATIDPLGDWCPLLDQAKQDFAGVLVSPYFHRWSLQDTNCRDFFESCAKDKFPVWINCDLGDNRFYVYPIPIRPVNTSELSWFAANAPLNTYYFQALHETGIDALLTNKRSDSMIYCEISRLTDVAGSLLNVLRKFGRNHFVFGSEYPLRAMPTVKFVADSILACDNHFKIAT